jgi:dienelactone hydrolase
MKLFGASLASMLTGACWFCVEALAAPRVAQTAGEGMILRYFESETAALESRCLASSNAVTSWKADISGRRRELRDMLGLDPLPPRGDLKAVVTGQFEFENIIVEKLHFQAIPGLYVTANLYRPKQQSAPAPTILYLSGHGPVVSNGVSYGNKVAYQHHGAWFARNGYVCLITDTVELGEIQGQHHGTYRDHAWWWNSRGYTPAGVETWSSIRALDYLSTRPEVDTNRFGVTGRSGGGAYSWWTAALDERVKVAAPVAGITDLRNHIVDGAVEGHCDCMFTVNTYRWDYPQVAALVAPRPLLICNSDNDWIFPLDGVERLHRKVKMVYEAYGAATNLGLLITEGPHKDTQDLQLPVFRWFNRKLKNQDPVIEMAAVKLFRPEQLKVFDKLPDDAINKIIQETFVPKASAADLKPSDWEQKSASWLAGLRNFVFGGWPATSTTQWRTRFSVERDGVLLRGVDFLSQPGIRLRLYVLSNVENRPVQQIILNVLSAETNAPSTAALQWNDFANFLNSEFPDDIREERVPNPGKSAIRFEKLKPLILKDRTAIAFMAPRATGLNAWSADERTQTHLRRRFMLVGQTLDGMRAWDIRQAIQTVRSIAGSNAPVRLQAQGNMAVNVLYASLFEPVKELQLWNLPPSHRDGPDYLNVMRIIDIPQAVFLAQRNTSVSLHESTGSAWQSVLNITKAQSRAGKGSLSVD